MTLLLNWLLPAILGFISFLCFLSFKKKESVGDKIQVAAFGVATLILAATIYNGLQTTYLPKGSVQALPAVHFEPKDVQIKDLTAKPKEREFEEYLTVRGEVEEILKGPAKTVTDQVAEQVEYQKPQNKSTHRDHQNVYE